MSRSRRQRGEGKLGCLVGVVFMLIGLFIAYKMIPVKIRAAEMRQEVFDQAKAGGMRSDERIMAALLRKAEEENLPITSDQVKIHRSQSTISVDVEYVVPVDFPGYKYMWEFHHHAENPMF